MDELVTSKQDQKVAPSASSRKFSARRKSNHKNGGANADKRQKREAHTNAKIKPVETIKEAKESEPKPDLFGKKMQRPDAEGDWVKFAGAKKQRDQSPKKDKSANSLIDVGSS